MGSKCSEGTGFGQDMFEKDVTRQGILLQNECAYHVGLCHIEICKLAKPGESQDQCVNQAVLVYKPTFHNSASNGLNHTASKKAESRSEKTRILRSLILSDAKGIRTLTGRWV
jgi:hypothetical protein